jgi:hypothetical protein
MSYLEFTKNHSNLFTNQLNFYYYKDYELQYISNNNLDSPKSYKVKFFHNFSDDGLYYSFSKNNFYISKEHPIKNINSESEINIKYYTISNSKALISLKKNDGQISNYNFQASATATEKSPFLSILKANNLSNELSMKNIDNAVNASSIIYKSSFINHSVTLKISNINEEDISKLNIYDYLKNKNNDNNDCNAIEEDETNIHFSVYEKDAISALGDIESNIYFSVYEKDAISALGEIESNIYFNVYDCDYEEKNIINSNKEHENVLKIQNNRNKQKNIKNNSIFLPNIKEEETHTK